LGTQARTPSVPLEKGEGRSKSPFDKGDFDIRTLWPAGNLLLKKEGNGTAKFPFMNEGVDLR